MNNIMIIIVVLFVNMIMIHTSADKGSLAFFDLPASSVLVLVAADALSSFGCP